METRTPYPTDVSDEEWAVVAPSLTLVTPDAPQREHNLREVFNATRWIVRAGAPWRYLPHEVPPWHTVYDQTQRWLRAGSCAAIVHDLRALLRLAQGRNAQPSAVVLDARTRQCTPESGSRAGYDGHKRKKGSKTHMAVDTLGNLLAMVVTPANEQERSQVWRLVHLLSTLVTGLVLAWATTAGNSSAAPRDLSPIRSAASAAGSWLAGWPMIGHDPQRTNRSPDVGPSRLHLHWSMSNMGWFAIIGDDGTIYTSGAGGILALDRSGHRRWTYPVGDDGAPPVLLPDGTVALFGLPPNAMDPARSMAVLLTPAGTARLAVHIGGFSKGATSLSTATGKVFIPIIGPRTLRAMYGGFEVLSATSGAHRLILRQHGVAAIARAPQGTVYAVAEDYHGGTVQLLAVSPAGRIRWTRRVPGGADPLSDVLLARGDGVIMAFGHTVWSYDDRGRLRWRYRKADQALSLAERQDGTLLVAGVHTLDTISSAGKRLWQARIGASPGFWSPALAVDANGTAYVASADGGLSIVSRTGQVLERLAISLHARHPQRPTLAIGPGRTLILTDTAGNLRVYGPQPDRP